MTLRNDRTGKRFGKLQVVSFAGHRGKNPFWNCICDCGNEICCRGDVLSVPRPSCGCVTSLRTRTSSNEKIPGFYSWKSMVRRCHDQNNKNYPQYGGIGIIVYARWRGNDGFKHFIEDMGPRPSNASSIDRYPNQSGNYEPKNCRWATVSQQMRNKRNNRLVQFRGTVKCVADVALEVGMHRQTLIKRLNRGMTIDEAVAIG